MALDEKNCEFCFSNQKDEVLLGEWSTIRSLQVHYYCLLFSSCLEQNGEDDDGIFGFLEKDIRKELKRGSTLVCTYCRKSGATIQCMGQNCNVQFHLPCGLKNHSFHEFFGRFFSFCKTHRPKVKGRPSGICHICLEINRAKNCYNFVNVTCCKDEMWFHRRCIGQLALTAGKHFLKCPLCNNNKEFIEQIETQGVYIPERDAAWETEPGAFQDLLFRPNKCDMFSCKCPKGRKFNQVYTKWEIYICNVCGATGAHQGCTNIIELQWTCNQCEKMIQEMSLRQKEAEKHENKEKKKDSGETSSGVYPRPTFISKTDETDMIVIDSDNEEEENEKGSLKEPTSMLVTKDGIRIPVYRFTNDSPIDEPSAEKKRRLSNSEYSSSSSGYHRSHGGSTSNSQRQNARGRNNNLGLINRLSFNLEDSSFIKCFFSGKYIGELIPKV